MFNLLLVLSLKLNAIASAVWRNFSTNSYQNSVFTLKFNLIHACKLDLISGVSYATRVLPFACLCMLLSPQKSNAAELPVVPKQPEIKKLEQTLKDGEAQKRFLNTDESIKISPKNTGQDSTQCVAVKKLVLAEIWMTKAGEKSKEFELENSTCLSGQALLDWISALVSRTREKGFLVTNASIHTPNNIDIIKADSIRVEVRVLGLDKFDWPFRDTRQQNYGWELNNQQPVNVRQLDSIIESYTRLSRNDPRIDIIPDEKNQIAVVQVKNSQTRPVQAWLALNKDENKRIDGGVSVEDLTGFGEKNSFMFSRTTLKEGHSDTINWLGDLPLGPNLFDARIRDTSVKRTIQQDTGNLDYQQSESELALNFSRSIIRSANQILKFSGGIRGVNLKAELEGEKLLSQSPHLRMLELNLNLQRLALGGMWLTDYKFKKGISALGASSDRELGVDSRTSAHAQFESHHLQTIFMRRFSQESSRSIIFVLQGFYANHGLYPVEAFSLASSYAVEGNIRESTLVDYGITGRAGINNLLSGRINDSLEWQSNVAVSFAHGKKYIDEDKLNLSSLSVDLSLRHKYWTAQLKFAKPIKKYNHTSHQIKTEANLQLSW